MRSSNPALSGRQFETVKEAGIYNDIMTLEGTVSKSIYLLGMLIAAGIVGYKIAIHPSFGQYSEQIMGSAAFLAFIIAMITIFKQSMSPTTAPAYALLKGLSLGFVSFLYSAHYTGIALQAILLTISVFVVLLVCYRLRIIEPTQNFRLAIVSATGGILVLYLLSFAGSFLGWQIPYLHESGPVGIGLSVAIVGVASLNLVLDFDFIERGSENKLPKYMEWYGAFGLLITLVWLYIEILRLLAKLKEK